MILRDLRQNKAITVQPAGVLRVELHDLVPEDVGDRRHAPNVMSVINLACVELILEQS